MSTGTAGMKRKPRTINDGPRIKREKATVAVMIATYCKGHGHSRTEGPDGGEPGLCLECEDLLKYACLRLEHCRFGESKTTCGRCQVHCYKPDRRSQIKAVMRYAGPRMLWSHPLTTLRHLLDGMTSARTSSSG